MRYFAAINVFSMLFFLLGGKPTMSAEEAPGSNNVPVAAPIDTDSAGKGGEIAQVSVMRVILPKG